MCGRRYLEVDRCESEYIERILGELVIILEVLGWVLLGVVIGAIGFHGPITARTILENRKTAALAKKINEKAKEGVSIREELVELNERLLAIHNAHQASLKDCILHLEELQAAHEVLIAQRAKLDFALEQLPALRDAWLGLSEDGRSGYIQAAKKRLFTAGL